MRLRVLYHGNCFDGCSSAGIFARFYREKIVNGGELEVLFRPLEHKGDAQPFPADCFDGDENVCVDFRYSQDPRLSWWFDHHASAFQLPGDEAHFRADATGRKFYDPAAKSCASDSPPRPSAPIRTKSRRETPSQCLREVAGPRSVSMDGPQRKCA